MAEALILSIFSVFAVMIPGYYLSRINIINTNFLKVLTAFIVRVAYPFLTFSSVIKNFTFDTIVQNFHLPLMMMLVIILAYIGIRVFWMFYSVKSDLDKRTVTYVGTFSNYIFLPYAVVSYAMDERMAAAVVIASLGAEIVTWSLGVFILKKDAKLISKQTFKQLFSAPLRGLYFGILVLCIFKLLGIEDKESLLSGKFVNVLWNAVEAIAKTTVPLTLTMAGANIAKVDFSVLKMKKVWGVMVYRLILAPLLIITVLNLLMPGYEYIVIFYIVAIMPTAFNSMVLGEMFGANMKLVGGVLLVSYLISLVTMPLWLLILL